MRWRWELKKGLGGGREIRWVEDVEGSEAEDLKESGWDGGRRRVG